MENHHFMFSYDVNHRTICFMFHRKLWQVPEGIHWFLGHARYICSYWGKPPNITGSGHHISIYYGVTSSNHPTLFFRVPRIDDAYLVKLVSKRHFPQLKHQLPQWYHHFPEFNYHFPSRISAMSRVHDQSFQVKSPFLDAPPSFPMPSSIEAEALRTRQRLGAMLGEEFSSEMWSYLLVHPANRR